MIDKRESEIEQWYRQYHQTIYKYIVVLVKDPQQAEDLTHETFVKAYKNFDRFRRDSSPKTWLFRIAHNVTVDYIRKMKPIQLFKEVFRNKGEQGLSAEEIFIIKENSEELFVALSELKDSYKQVILLRKVKGFSIEETALILNCSESKVKATMFRALKALKEKLKKEVTFYEYG
ncbi:MULTISPECIES: RNA polymerase sigma factor [Sutcliffiella]|uniref:RNA polymerase sigma factor n=1 Tax=Sutcliffiella TaxID=2837511 RepID=UPI000836D5A6|nr:MULTISPECIES: RNA polymerase sigma factor [Sutcliffiella]MED4016438.1 RNA polymerase sigma factor [Sutcliffiella cohnii]WBL13910.1 RNA polymerase sigma factor [Sutcliffiella sp. NC1]